MAGFLPTIFFFFFYLISIPTVHSSDTDTLRRLFSHLGIDTDTDHPCRTPGIACEIKKDSVHVTRIRLPSRGLRGSIPTYISDLPKLRELSLHDNNLIGPLPSEISECRNLEVLNLRNNRFAGRVPESLSSLTSLRALDLSSNKFSGDLSFLTHFPNLENLSLSDNLFSGPIPSSLSLFRNLVFLDLEDNPDLSRDRSPSLRRSLLLRKQSNSTRRPSGALFAPAPSPLPSSTFDHRHVRKHRVRNFILGFAAGTIGGLASGAVLSAIFRMLYNCIHGWWYRKNTVGPSIFSSIIKNADDLKFLEKDDVLAALEVIGRGGCGEVYRAPLPTNPEKMLAIKKITKRSADCAEPDGEESRLLDKWMRQIRSEIQTVGHIRHRNLLPLLAHVTRPDCHFLIYEYMKNGSLHDVMAKSSTDPAGSLDWIRRHRIALGIAAGLEYLHVHHRPRIIHRDLKPANVLLDDNMEARITDFGLAKEVPDANTHITASNVAGTVGYIAPEYHQTLKFTTKCDVYSFGVILGVLVMGKFPSDGFFQDTEEMSLVKWVRNVVNSENPRVAIDGKLMGNGYEEQMLLVLKIACFCTSDDPKDRPSSKDVRLMLSQIQH